MGKSITAPPPHLSRRFLATTAQVHDQVREALVTHYFSSPGTFPDVSTPEEYFTTSVGAQDLDDHLTGRLHVARHTFVPWIDSLLPLREAAVLEVGCGTGSSTVALAEQGAEVTAVDVDEDSLRAARGRLAAYGLHADTKVGNATQLDSVANIEHFGAVVFYASVEHMTLDERLTSLARTWSSMREGAVLIITDTPNRLWYFDHHTSFSNFYFWLPDDLALAYASRTPRPRFRDALGAEPPDPQTALARWGRGVSYHDLEVALDTAKEDLDVIGCLQLFLQEQRSPFAAPMTQQDRDYVDLLAQVARDTDKAWLLPNLDVALRKPAGAALTAR